MIKIEFGTKGGFAGLDRLLKLTGDMLNTDELQQLNNLIEKADFFNLSENFPRSGVADDFEFKLTIETENKKHTVKVDGQSVPSTLEPLILFLRKKEGLSVERDETMSDSKEVIITVIGTLTDEGVECQAMRSKDDNKLFTLVGNLEGFKNGDQVQVIGRTGGVSFCMQGTTIGIDKITKV